MALTITRGKDGKIEMRTSGQTPAHVNWPAKGVVEIDTSPLPAPERPPVRAPRREDGPDRGLSR